MGVRTSVRWSVRRMVWRMMRRSSRVHSWSATISSVGASKVNVLRILHLEEGVVRVNIIAFTELAEVEVWALNALVSDSNNWTSLAAVTSDPLMDWLLSFF